MIFTKPRLIARRAWPALALMVLTVTGQIANAADPRLLLSWGKHGVKPGEFDFPIGIAVNLSNEVLVTDHYNHRVQRFDREGTLLGIMAVLPNPGGIALDKSGNIYLSHFPQSTRNKEKNPDRLTVYSSAGKLLHVWGKTGTGSGEFQYPGGLVVDPNGRLYIADQTNHRIQVLDLDGRFLSTWGKHGTKHGEFGGNTNPRSRAGGPDFIARDKQGNVYTTEAMDGRVQKFTSSGDFLLSFGTLEDRPGGFGRDFEMIGKMHGPIGICCDRDDRLWISAAGGRVQQFTNDGHYLRGFGEQGDEPGQFLAPHGVVVDSWGDLYVVDTYNHCVQKFDVGAASHVKVK